MIGYVSKKYIISGTIKPYLKMFIHVSSSYIATLVSVCSIKS